MNVLVGFIPTEEGRAALRYAADIASKQSMRLVIIDSQDPDKYDGAKAVELNAEMAQIRAGLDRHGVEHEEHIYVRGNGPVDDIVQAATDYNATVLVIGLRVRGQLARMMLGSHAEQIITRAPCPVLCVKADQADFEEPEVPGDSE